MGHIVGIRAKRIEQFKGQDVGDPNDPETADRIEQLELAFPGSDTVSQAQVDAVKARA